MKMDCVECVYKHLMETEHHLKDLVTVKSGKDRKFFQALTDNIRNDRKVVFQYIIDHPECIECSAKFESGSNNPSKLDRCVKKVSKSKWCKKMDCNPYAVCKAR